MDKHLYRCPTGRFFVTALGCALSLGLVCGETAAHAQGLPLTPAKTVSAPAPPANNVLTTDPSYVIGLDDVVSISSIGNDEVANAGISVMTDGTIHLKGIPKAIHAEGMTVRQLREAVYKELNKYYNNLNITVAVKESHSRYVTIIGAKASGQFALLKDMTVAQLIAKAGGAPIVKVKYVIGNLIRDNKTIKLDIPKLIGEKVDPNADIVLRPHDYIILDTVDEAPPPTFSVIGAVSKTGSYALPLDGSPFTVAQAISVSGGRTTAADLVKVSLLRDGKKTNLNLHPFLVEGKADAPEAKVELKDGDVLLFPEAQAKYMVLGQVNRPASFPLPETEKITVLRALADAGGPAPDADMRKAGIMRMVDGKMTFIKIDLMKMVSKAKLENNILMQDADVLYVPQKGKQYTIYDALTPLYILQSLGLQFR